MGCVQSDASASNYDPKGHIAWEKAWNKWSSNGFPQNDPQNPKPGPHPHKDHLWNSDPEKYC